MQRLCYLAGPLCFTVMLFLHTPAHCSEIVDRLNVFGGVGISSDPDDDDSSVVYSMALGYSAYPHISVGLELRKLDSTQTSRGWSPNVYGKAALFPRRVFNPYARVAVGTLKVREERRGSVFVAVGLELGTKNFGIYSELGDRFIDDPVSAISLVGGLSIHGGF